MILQLGHSAKCRRFWFSSEELSLQMTEMRRVRLVVYLGYEEVLQRDLQCLLE